MRVKKGLCSPHAALGNMAHCSTQWRRIVGAASADATLSIPHVCRGNEDIPQAEHAKGALWFRCPECQDVYV